MNLISMDKRYRRRGGTEPVRVLCVDAKGDFPVIYLDEDRNWQTTDGYGRTIRSPKLNWRREETW